MDRYVQSGGSATPPTPDPNATNNYHKPGSPGGSPASVPGAYFFHMISESLRRLVERPGLTPDHTNLDLIANAVEALIEARVGDFALATGVADAYVAALNPAIAAYTDNFTARLKIPVANTGATTVDFGPGAVPLVRDDGVPLVAGDLPVGVVISVEYVHADSKAYITAMVPSQVGLNVPVGSKVAAYNVVSTDAGRLIDCNGTFPVTLLAPSTAGDGFSLAIRNSGTGKITVTDGAYTRVLPAGCSVLVSCDATAYKEIASGGFGLGENQTLQDVLASRALGVNYTNDTGKTIYVYAGVRDASTVSRYITLIDFGKGSVGSSDETNVSNQRLFASGPIPDGEQYQVSPQGLGSQTLISWLELRSN